MKKIKHLFLVILLLGITGMVKAADVSLVNFESPTSIGTLSGGSLWTGSSGSLYVGANPSVSGINTTSQAAYAIRTTSQGSTFQAEFNVPTQNYNGVKYFHIMIYRPKQSKMELKGRQQTPDAGYATWSDRFTSQGLFTIAENEWVDVVFKYNFGTSNLRIDRFVLSLDMVSPTGRYTSDTNVYFDEIIVNDDPQPRGDASYSAAKTVSFPENFEGTSTIADYRYFLLYHSWSTNSGDNNSWACYQRVIDNPAKTAINNSDKVLKLERLAGGDYWSRIIFTVNPGTTGMALSASKKYIHAMVKKSLDNSNNGATPTNKGELALRLYYSDGTNDDWIRPLYNYVAPNWQDVVFEIPAASVNKTLNRFDFYPHTTSNGIPLVVYMDEIEFNASSTPRTSIATSATNYFRSVGSGSWDNLANWESSSDNSYWIPATAIPTSQATAVDINPATQITMPTGTALAPVTVKAGGKLTLNNNVTLNGVTLQSDATGTATFVDTNNDSPQSVTATVQQHLTAERNWYTASPIATGTASGLSLGTSVQTYNESSKAWTTLSGSTELVPGKGYVSVAGTGTGTTGTVSFSGTLNTGTIEVPVTRTGTDKAGFNLVANPYPSYLDWSLVTADPLNANIGTTMWFRTKTAANAYTFSTYNSAGNVAVANSAATTITKYIPPMQAFWIRVNSGTASTNLTFKNTMRSHRDVNGNTLKAPQADNQKLVRLQVSNGTNSDEAVLYFDSNAQNGFDTYDSQKMFNNNPTQPEIYTLANNEQLVINGLNELALNSEQMIGFNAGETSNYSIAVTELKNLEGKIYLKDKLLNNEVELTENTVYPFSSGTVKTTDRFSLIFRATGNATALNNQKNPLNAIVFVSAGNIEVRSNEAIDNSMLKVYSVTGELLYQAPVFAGVHTVKQKLNAGVYLVSVTASGNTITKRVIIQ